ncbi:MAG TPA: hypothetical protein VJZ50_02900 [Candidatus Limnocylindrales bacterium]|nr:hypothetical protein [Candidatus Limnocylindrales bacterium]
MRAVGLAAAMLVLGAVLLVIVAVAARPLLRTCAPTLSADSCAETVEASLKRGLPPLHPLILASHVEPGPAAASTELGHKATVTFDLLGIPGPTSVRLYLDMGGHWGGVSSRDEVEVAAWALAPLLVAGLAALVIVGLARRRRTAMGGAAL